MRLSPALGRVHALVGVAQKLLQRALVLRAHRRGGGAYPQNIVAPGLRVLGLHLVLDPLEDPRAVIKRLHGHQRAELVAAQARDADLSTSAASQRRRSPASWPRVSLTCLSPSISANKSRISRPSSCAARIRTGAIARNPRRFNRPVSGSRVA